MKRLSGLALAGLLLVTVAGCMTSRVVTLQHEIDQDRTGVRMYSRPGEHVAGYTDARGYYHEFDGFVRALPGDSMELCAPAPAGTLAEPGLGWRVAMPRDSVRTIFVKQINVPLTVLAVIGTTVAVAGVAIAVALATKESCPFIYSWDGKQYVFDGEPYGGATIRALERTDWSELEHLTASRGQYRLMLTNEVDETQHTNRIVLQVVDHPAGTTVVMDREGGAHAFRRLAPLTAARDETGRDLLTWLQRNDRAAWSPDLRAYAREDSVADTRNHITLEFARPPGVTRAFLVSNAATGQWGSHMIRSMLGLRGNRVQEFYAAVNGSALVRRQLLDWNRREELFELTFEVRRGEEWVRQDFIPGGGPFISESRAIPVDLAGVTGDRVRIRIHPPIGFWSLNSFHLAWESADASVTEVLPEMGSGAGGANVVEALRATDSLALDFPNRGDRTELTFTAPPPRPGMERTVFAETRGWYEVHLHDLAAPDVAALERLTYEPGYVVRRALREFTEYERTGVLQGVATVPAQAGGR